MMDIIQSGKVKPLGAGGFGEVFKVGDYIVKRVIITDHYDIKAYNDEILTWKKLSLNESMKPYMPVFCTSKHLNFDRPPQPKVNYFEQNNSKKAEQLKEFNIWIKEHSEKPLAAGFIFQKYEPVSDLHDLIYKWSSNKLSTEKGYKLFNDLVTAFNIFHNAGYIHRDIKPANILIKHADLKPLIVDFGLACEIPCLDTFAVGTTAFLPQNILEKNDKDRQNNVCEFPVKQEQIGFFESMKRSLGCSRSTRRRLGKVRVKLGTNVANPEYNRASDRYSLSIVLKELSKVVDWSDDPELKKYVDHIIIKYRSGIIPYLAASIGSHKTGAVGGTRSKKSRSNQTRLRRAQNMALGTRQQSGQ